MAPFCSNVILFFLCGCSGVQGSNMDLASLVQARMEGHAQAPWKAQAQSFLGLLQAMGKQVPGDKQDETKTMVQSIITLLTTAKNALTSDVSTTADICKQNMQSYTGYVKEYNTTATTALAHATTTNAELTQCYVTLRSLQATHGGLFRTRDAVCGCEQTPLCTAMENTKKHQFTVSKKFEWKCNFNNSETDETCTNDASALKKDLVAKKKTMLESYEEWKDLKGQCAVETQTCKTDCKDSDDIITAKKSTCEQLVHTINMKLCAFKSATHTRTEWVGKLETSITEAEVMHENWSKKTEFIDLSLIICIFEKFKSSMNFAQEDYRVCQEMTKDPVFVTPPTIPTPRVPAGLISPDNIKFGGGLAAKYLGENDALGTPKQVHTQVDIDFTTRPQCSSQ